MSRKRGNVIRDALRQDIEDDVLFRASDVSRSSRQYWSMIDDGDRRYSYKQFNGWQSNGVRKFLIGSASKVIFEVSFLAFRAGLQKDAAVRIVEFAFNKNRETDPLA